MIDYIRTYKKFVSSHHFYEGIRMTAGVMAPVLLFNAYEQLAWGVTVALGAFCVSIADNPGPVHHRRNGMLFTIALLFASILITGLSVPFPWLVLVLLAVLPFSFSMLGVFGIRATSVGLAGMLVMVLNIDKSLTTTQVFMNAMLTVAGGAWYFLLSMTLHQLRPYKLVQQVLGDCMQETAAYLRIKAKFYEKEVDFDKSYESLTEAQVQVHNKQEATRELLFKTRSIIKESTHTGRVLLMAFIDTVDLFERIMTSQQEYRKLHRHFANTALLPAFQHSIMQLANDLEELGIAFQEGKAVSPLKESSQDIETLETIFREERNALLIEENEEAFLSLGQVLRSIKDLKRRIDTLHIYSSYDLNLQPPDHAEREFKRFVTRSNYSPGIIVDNLNPQSNIFRHAARVSMALLAGYILSMVLPLGHDYWILLTIIVILKPAYALTRQRNIQRLIGTVAGAAIGGLALYLIKDTYVLIAIILLCMVVAYSFMRVHYLVSVIFMTSYILLAFHFLKAGDVTELLKDRIVDTAIGSGISFLFLFLLPPKWEHENIKSLCAGAIEANKRYFAYIAGAFFGEQIFMQQYKLRRMETYVALANLSDAFQRMLNEPKSKQQGGEYLHQLIVSNHVLASHIASLSAYRLEYAGQYQLPVYETVVMQTGKQLDLAQSWLHPQALINKEKQLAEPLEKEEPFTQIAMQQAEKAVADGILKLKVYKAINTQFETILNVATDIKVICKKLL